MADLIDRQQAIDAVSESAVGKRMLSGHRDLIEILKCLPSAQKTGRWTKKSVFDGDGVEEWQTCQCSECKRWDARPYMYYFDEPRFCSFCGAKMQKGEQDG